MGQHIPLYFSLFYPGVSLRCLKTIIKIQFKIEIAMLKVTSRHLPGVTETNPGKPQSKFTVAGILRYGSSVYIFIVLKSVSTCEKGKRKKYNRLFNCLFQLWMPIFIAYLDLF